MSSAQRRALSALFLFCACAYVLWLARPDLIFAAGSPPDTDLGGHLVALSHLINVSLPAGYLHDWSHSWFGGYPSFYFYFPLPALVIAALSTLMPIANAAKLVAVIAPAILPVCTYILVRNAGFSRVHACAGALGAVTSLSLTTQYIHGGNVLSSVIGEYSYALGLCFTLLYLGRLARAARSGNEAGGNEVVVLSVLLALSALTHVIPTIFAVLVSCGFLGHRHMRGHVLKSWAVGFALSAFWSIPFLVRSPFMAYMPSPYDVRFTDILPLPLLIMFVFTVAAAVVLRPRLADARVLILLAAAGLLMHLVPQTIFVQGRTLPLWYLAVYVLTGLGIAEGLATRARGPWPHAFWTAGLALLAGVSVAQAELIRNRSATLLSSERRDSAPYSELMTSLRGLPAGRVHWEHRGVADDILGSTVGLARIPLHAPQHTTTFGLLLQSGFMMHVYGDLNAAILRAEDDTPAHMLRLLGINYFVTFSPEIEVWAGSQPGILLAVERTGDWTLWQVAARPPVEALPHALELATPRGRNESLRAWRSQIQAEAHHVRAGAPDGAVSDVEYAHRRIRFTTALPGAPHLVRASYFPNWRTDDAAGPFLVAPGFMMVIPDRPDVELRFEWTWVEVTGLLLSVASAAVLVGWIGLQRVTRARARRPRTAAGPGA